MQLSIEIGEFKSFLLQNPVTLLIQIQNRSNLLKMMQIDKIFVPNIFFTKLVEYFWIYLQKTWRAGQVILKFGMLSNEVMLRKKPENNNFTWAALLGANISQIFSPPF